MARYFYTKGFCHHCGSMQGFEDDGLTCVFCGLDRTDPKHTENHIEAVGQGIHDHGRRDLSSKHWQLARSMHSGKASLGFSVGNGTGLPQLNHQRYIQMLSAKKKPMGR